jgi:tetratricopeptide (TPR) repeat protein
VEAPTPTPTPVTAPVASAPAPTLPPEKRLEWPTGVRDPRPYAQRSRADLASELAKVDTRMAGGPSDGTERTELAGQRAEILEQRARLEGTNEAYQQAADALEKFVADHPKAPRRDEALYALTLIYDVLDRLDLARRTAYTLIKDHPASRWVHYAYFEFGELFARSAAEAPDRWQLARVAYERAVQSRDEPLAAESMLRMAEAHRAMGDVDQARKVVRQLRARFPKSEAAARATE